MTTWIENLVRWLYPRGNWGSEVSDDPSAVREWGRLFVHLYVGCLCALPVIVVVHWLNTWGLIGLFLPLMCPLVREFIIDRHPLKDAWVDTPEGIDCRSDILSCWVGSLVALPFVGLAWI